MVMVMGMVQFVCCREWEGRHGCCAKEETRGGGVPGLDVQRRVLCLKEKQEVERGEIGERSLL